MNKFTTVSIATALLLAMGANVAIAQQRGHAGGFDFAAVDLNADGEITSEELAAYRARNFAEMDTDASGTLDQAELLAAAQARNAERMATRTARMIERADTDADGVLSQAEMDTARRGGDLFERLDTDDSGSVSQAELEAAREQRAERRGEHGGCGERGERSPRG